MLGNGSTTEPALALTLALSRNDKGGAHPLLIRDMKTATALRHPVSPVRERPSVCSPVGTWEEIIGTTLWRVVL